MRGDTWRSNDGERYKSRFNESTEWFEEEEEIFYSLIAEFFFESKMR